jgi:hypothetical protein
VAGAEPLLLKILAVPASLVGHRLFDRLVASKAWIGLVAFALIGIVSLQLGLIELSGGIGRTLAREEALQRQNAALAVANSEIAAGEQVYSGAEKLGMQPAPSGLLRPLTANPRSDPQTAAGALSTPDAPASEGPASATGGGEPASAPAGGEQVQESSGPEPSQQATGGSEEQRPEGEASSGSTASTQGSGEAAAAGGASAEGSATGSG